MRWKVPDSVDRISVENQQFDVGPLQAVERDGSVVTIRGIDVPAHLDSHMKMLGFVQAAKPVGPPTDAAGLRLDGPTYEEYVAAGYAPDTYPPQGYASKGVPDEAKRDEIALRAALTKMSSEELKTWLVEHDVPLDGLTNKPLRLAAAFSKVGMPEQVKA